MIRIRVFGRFRDLLGKPYIELDLDEIELGDILKMVTLRDGTTLMDHISLGDKNTSTYRIFLNRSVIDSKYGLKRVVKSGDEIVITPPVSAGN
jgi:molybdopterin converting factor small subunit